MASDRELALEWAAWAREQAANERDAVIVPSSAEAFAALLSRWPEDGEMEWRVWDFRTGMETLAVNEMRVVDRASAIAVAHRTGGIAQARLLGPWEPVRGDAGA